jgi:hypothetical protein
MGSEVNGSLTHRSTADFKPRQLGQEKSAAADEVQASVVVENT